MKKNRRASLSFIFLFMASAPALAEFNVILSDTPPDGCRKVVEKTYDVTGSELKKTQFISFLSTDGDKYISNSRTTMSIYSSEDGAVSGCLTPDSWKKKSDVAPDGVEVVAWAANCVFGKPARESSKVIISYDIGFSAITSDGSEASKKFFITPAEFEADPDRFSYMEFEKYKSVPEGVADRTCTVISLQ